MRYKELFNHLKKIVKTRTFNKGSIYGCGTEFDYTANCINQTGFKSRVTIGSDCLIRGTIKVVGEGKIKIGDNAYIGGFTIIGAVDSIEIGNNVIISTEVHIYDNNNHPTSPRLREEMSTLGDFFGSRWQWTESAHKAIVIEDNVWIGERSTILKGVTIGRGSVVACNAVVTRDIPEFSIVAGNPAIVVKKLR